MKGKNHVLTFSGNSISPGMAEGIIYLHPGLLGPIDVPVKIRSKGVEEEYSRLDEATAKISEDLIALASKVEKEIDSRLSQVFGAHKQILNDAALKEEIKKEIVDNLVCASSAVKSVFLRWEMRFLLMESRMAREKGDDLRDISIRLRNALAGITVHPAAALSSREIAIHVDFMSFGTNDLTQYTFAADRENAAVEAYFNDASEVIIRLMQLVHQDVPDMPLSVCGELGFFGYPSKNFINRHSPHQSKAVEAA